MTPVILSSSSSYTSSVVIGSWALFLLALLFLLEKNFFLLITRSTFSLQNLLREVHFPACSLNNSAFASALPNQIPNLHLCNAEPQTVLELFLFSVASSVLLFLQFFVLEEHQNVCIAPLHFVRNPIYSFFRLAFFVVKFVPLTFSWSFFIR
ncbi:hypothetical protein Tco_0321602 [Tanacetum coccineum]